ncbi:MAG TPA: neuraminidase-like domain-containing protein [Candidatus Binatia bacterium]|nr:neuraminidase-like domain-containing protein [Candidatus Binatia bacterium]
MQQVSAQLGLTEALTRRLLTHYAVLPDTLLAHLTGAFAATTGVVDYATLKATFDGWFWASRVAAILKKWKITLAELEKISALTAGAQLLDFLTLPLDDTGVIASAARFLRTSRLLRLRDSLPETEVTLLEILEKLSGGAYATAADFATDVERLNDAWLAADVEALIASLDLAYPGDYLLAESWERLRRAFYFLDNLNAGADTVKTFAAAAMTDAHAKTLKGLLRSKFGEETWLTLSAEIQDVLRERKRDALAAYLLIQPMPTDAPSGKWENTNDLYAYYLLDVEMSACQLTSRLVQASGSVQLFVQRCFMGLEPDVKVKADGDDGDSAWRWWKWMRKYRVWEANRKVFLWPENWIEPELKKDKSQFFKDLENELLQNEINQYTVESAFSNYLEKLDGVAQLEIAGFYQEDDGDNTILHAFGRTTGAEPHLYYYRRYDYRQWTPWEKVDLDIQGDYLIPAVVNKRLFLFWPVFTEVPDEAGNSSVKIPKAPGNTETTFSPDKTKKRLRLQMAVSEYRQGKWTPKKVSKDFDESAQYEVEIVKKSYQFAPIDRTEVDGRFVIDYGGYSLGKDGKHPAALSSSAFEISGCKGVPERTQLTSNLIPVIRPEVRSTGHYTAFLKWVELGQPDEFGRLEPRQDHPENDFTLENSLPNQPDYLYLTPVLMQTPWIFKISPPWHLSYLDKLLLNGQMAFISEVSHRAPVLTGTWLPFFYSDKKRTFFVLPLLWERRGNRLASFKGDGSIRYYYPEIKKAFREREDGFEGQVQTWLDSLDLSSLAPAQRQQLEQFLWQAFPEEIPPPYTDAQVKNLMKRSILRFFHHHLGAEALALFQSRSFHFKNFYHPFVCDFAKLVYNPLKGIPALMSRETQLKDTGFSFEQVYQPTNAVVKLPPQYPTLPDCFPREVVDFTPDGAYSPYNWELFFHAPLLIANSLSKNQRFEEARNWYHFIFNPIGVESAVPGGSPMSKYWITKPFFETTDPQYVQQRIENIMRMLAGDTSVPGFSAQAKKDLEDQVLDWRTNPFEPHRIANYRTVAYQKTVVMKYLDNLVAWGDYLFRQDSMESINEATQLYILAAEILGPRPKKIPPQAKPPVESFNELEDEFDKFSNALVEVENLVPPLPGNGPDGADPAPLPLLYFCIPQNDKMLGYWDTVADRLYKIRHCMNIEGVVRQLALFEPPIDPGALVKAIAGGMDISAALADLNAPLPLHRFNVLLQKANEVCNDVKALGSALLAALEKKDAEALGLLRQSQEIRVLEAEKAVREKQIEEAKENLEGVRKSKDLVTIRRDYYQNIQKQNSSEVLQQNKLYEALVFQQIAQVINVAASVAHLIPEVKAGVAGFGGSPAIDFAFGGSQLGSSLQATAGGFSFKANIENYNANKASIQGGQERRWDDWKFQERLANKELEQIDKSIAAAELRIAIAEKELENHTLQIENAKATDAFMRSKYTNQELYQWQVGQISGVYFQSYKLAYDLAKRAERCFRFELGLQDSSYINFGYWDSLKKGLLSGEKLQYDLRRLETAYLEQNRREFELTRHVSLALLDPLALVKLRETGRCFFRLPEEIFDLDYPGHYFRRIKSVSLTLPCVVGPYTTISCTLRLLKNSIRINTANGDNGYPRNTDDQGLPADDGRFIENNIPVKAIAASNAQNDSGVFELSFRDERYLPFEGAGTVSDWSLELFSDLPANNPDPGNPDFGKPLRQFDYSTISDAILHVKYTAREDAGAFKNGAVAYLRDYFSQDGATPSLRMFNLRQEFPSQWHRFLHPANPANGNVFELEMVPSLFPIRDMGKTLKVNTVWLLARCTDTGSYNIVMTPPLPAPPPVGSDTMTLAPVNQYGGLHFSQKGVAALGIEVVPTDPPVKWQLKMIRPGGGNLQEDPVKKIIEVEDVLLVLGYEWE